jgi:AcrR family transcriptional regulator
VVTQTQPRPDRRRARHAATKQEIVAAAWRLAREQGLGAWSLRDVASAVGMQAPSLYVYFPSKNAVFDAMFADGYAALLRRIEPAAAEVAGRPAEEVLRSAATLFFEFCAEDPARYQLLFLRTLPGFEPSETSYALAQEVLAGLGGVLAPVGLGSPEQVDLWTALTVGLVTQQLSNDPGGDRWRRLVPAAVAMFLTTQAPAGPVAGGGRERQPPTIGS